MYLGQSRLLETTVSGQETTSLYFLSQSLQIDHALKYKGMICALTEGSGPRIAGSLSRTDNDFLQT